RAVPGMWRAGDPERHRNDADGRLREVAPGTGLVLADSRRWKAHDYLESPAQAIAKIESRSYSVLWSLPDDRWHQLVEPVIEELRRLPHPEVPIPRRSTDRVVVLERI